MPFDINQFPKDWGIIVFPISMSRVSNAQNPQRCVDVLKKFLPKVSANKIGVNFIYTEGLYMNFERDAFQTKNRFAQTEVMHMCGVQKLVKKNYRTFQIDSAFTFESWFQMYLSHKDFFNANRAVAELYRRDKEFRKLIAADARSQGRPLTKRQLAFFLEEHTFAYLLLNRQLSLRNEFVQGRESWVLLCYPGEPPRAQVYLFQADPLRINGDKNPYKGQYDLVSNRFISYVGRPE